MTLQTQPLSYLDEETPLTGLLAWDDARTDRRPGILVVHGAAGLDAHVETRASRLAELGFVVLACDLYGEGVIGDREKTKAKLFALRDDPTFLRRRATAGLTALAAHPQVDGRLAAIGFCFGGMTVLELAREGSELLGVVSFHGTLSTKQPAEPGQVKAKILVCHGALDPHVPIAQVTAFMDEMNHAGADWQLIAYSGAMHGFTHEGMPSTMPGVDHHAPTDARSWIAMKSFFTELFGEV